MQRDRHKFDYDVAISFAGEDRQNAKKLANLLKTNDVKVFFDEFEQANLWGKNIYNYFANVYTNQARYCIMLLSKHYANNVWTNHERQHAQARAFRENSEYILPVKLDDTEIPGLLETVSYLDLRRLSIEEVVRLMLDKLNIGDNSTTMPFDDILDIPLPQIRKKFTQRDKDKFIQETFDLMKTYFQKGLEKIENTHSKIECDFQAIHRFKFVCKIYHHGSIKNQAKIWLGGISSGSISYQEGNIDINNDNAYNDWLSVKDDGIELSFTPSGTWFANNVSKDKSFFNQNEAIEYLWRRLIAHFEY